MKAYLAIKGETYEGFEVLGIFRSKESAQKTLDMDKESEIKHWEHIIDCSRNSSIKTMSVEEYLEYKYWEVKEYELTD